MHQFVILQSSQFYNTQRIWQPSQWGCNVWYFTITEAIRHTNRKLTIETVASVHLDNSVCALLACLYASVPRCVQVYRIINTANFTTWKDKWTLGHSSEWDWSRKTINVLKKQNKASNKRESLKTYPGYFFPGGGLEGPIRRTFCQSLHPTLVPVFGPRLLPPSQGSSPKIWKI